MRPLQFRIVALIAAYGLALHALVSAFAVVPSTAAGPHIAGLCLNADQNNVPPGRHDASCALACATMDGEPAAPLPPVATAGAPVVALVLQPLGGATLLRPAGQGPPRARAPPSV